MKAPILPRRQHVEAPPVNRKLLTLGEYVERYLSSRDVTQNYAALLRTRIASFIQWYGSDLKISELTCDLANEWLSALLATGLTPVTVENYRRNLRSVWWAAYQEGDNDHPPLRLKKIRIPQQRIEAFTHEQIGKLVEAARELPGYMPNNGVRNSAMWQALILSAYSTGLRRGDLLSVRRSQIMTDGSAVIVQSKTGYRVCVQFSFAALEAVDAIQVEDDDRAIPWPYHTNALPRQFRRLLKAAGIARGSFRWLRRSCGSYAEAAQPGSGSRALGHRSMQVFNGHYNDESITVSHPASPPSLPNKGGRPRGRERSRQPPTVRLVTNRGGRLQLLYRDPSTKERKSVSSRTRDQATAEGLRAALEEKLRIEWQELTV